MATYYVRKTGSDVAPGDGSDAHPWLTLSKALATITIGGGHTVNVGDGTYGEDTSGTGYLYLSRAFVAEVVVQSEGGIAANVIIQSLTSTAFTVRVAGIRNLHFKNVSFIARTTTNNSTIKCTDAGTAYAGLKFTGCVFTLSGTVAQYCINLSGITLAAADITFTNCSFTRTGSATQAIIITGTRGAGQSVTLTGCTIGPTEAGYLITGIDTVTITNTTGTAVGNSSVAFRLDNIVAFDMDGCTLTATGISMVGCLMGADATGGNAIAGTIDNCTFNSTQSHGFEIGGAANGVIVTNITVNGGDLGIVMKGATNCTVSNAIVSHVSGTGLYFLGTTNSTYQDCTLTSPAGVALRIEALGGISITNCTFLRCKVRTTGTARLFSWSTVDDGGGNVCDYNCYSVKGSGGWVGVLGNPATNLATLRAAWAGYGDGSNDSHSRLCDATGTPFSRAFKPSYRGAFA